MRDDEANWRVMYHIADDAIVILDVFAKKTGQRRKRCSKPADNGWQCTGEPRKELGMRADKRRQLERAGWVIGDAGDFLGLSAEERRFVEAKLALADGLRRRRERMGLTQSAMAERLGSSQSRVAKMEAAHSTVSTDLLLKSLFRLGAGPADIARLLTTKTRIHAA